VEFIPHDPPGCGDRGPSLFKEMIMKSSTAKKFTVPSFLERWNALVEELLDSPSMEQIEALKALDQALSHEMDLIAEEIRPKGEMRDGERVGAIPVGFIRMQLDQKGRGNLEAYIAAKKADA
jgi:hypothetical protein